MSYKQSYKTNIDFLILDEAQRVKNYTKTASAIANVDRKHVLIITGTPIENRLIDIFSLMAILNPHLLGSLWEFSYQHCLFDINKPNKINAYYNLSNLKEELKSVLLRREKRKVLEQLLTGMRMVHNATCLVGEATNDSPKLEELKYILLEKLDLKKSKTGRLLSFQNG